MLVCLFKAKMTIQLEERVLPLLQNSTLTNYQPHVCVLSWNKLEKLIL